MSMFQWSSRANIALVGPTYNTTGSGSISDCFFCGSYKIDRMKMESYSSSAGLSGLCDIADPGDHHLSDPRILSGWTALPHQLRIWPRHFTLLHDLRQSTNLEKGNVFQWKINYFPGGLFCRFSVIAKDLPSSQKIACVRVSKANR